MAVTLKQSDSQGGASGKKHHVKGVTSVSPFRITMGSCHIHALAESSSSFKKLLMVSDWLL